MDLINHFGSQGKTEIVLGLRQMLDCLYLVRKKEVNFILSYYTNLTHTGQEKFTSFFRTRYTYTTVPCIVCATVGVIKAVSNAINNGGPYMFLSPR